MMMFDSKKNVSSVLSFNKGELKINCKDVVLKEKLEKIREIVKNNCENGNGWEYSDYLNFFKQLSRLKLDIFNTLFDEIINLLGLPLNDIQNILEDLDFRLDLHLFDDERCIELVEENGKNRQRITFVPHEFSTADIVLFFQRLNSEIDKFNHITLNKFEKDYGNCSLLGKEKIIQELINDFCEDPLIFETLVEHPYLEWIEKVDERNFIYPFLKDKVSYIKAKNLQKLKLRLLDYKNCDVSVIYKRQQATNYFSEVAKYKQKTRDIKKHSINF